ncbi:MAG: ketopantoate reductase [Gammaproteobacteria bacterium]|nr:ketopantoate reductase [Gammaproteobacteria bacterium]
MRIGIVGAGAVGGLLGVKLSLVGETVTFIDIGAHLHTLNERGIRLLDTDGVEHVVCPVNATASFAEAGPQDLVILAVKAYDLLDVAQKMQPMLTPDTIVLPVQNGIPWWYFHGHGGKYQGRIIETVDPGGMIARNIETERVIGCVVYPAAAIVAPGVVKHVEGNRMALGELDGSDTGRIRQISELLNRAGFKTHVLQDIRSEIWLKLIGNLAFNHICALTHATMVDVCRFPPTRELATRLMEEAQVVANRLGITLRLPIEKRLEGAEKVGKHKPSTLQDVEAGRRLELAAIIGSVVELGRLTETPTPHTDTVYALARLLDETLRSTDTALRQMPIQHHPDIGGGDDNELRHVAS